MQVHHNQKCRGHHDVLSQAGFQKVKIMITRTLHDHTLEATGSNSSGVSWGAILAGASAAAALSFILVILGFGLGFSSVSPWSGSGLSAKTIGYSTIAWVAFTQIAASAIGGYMAGRLRVKWTALHTDEVYFRDTAHGFLAWAIASLVTAAVLSSAMGNVLAGGAKVMASTGAAAVAAGSAAISADGNDNNGNTDGMAAYFIDSLFRTPAAASSNNGDAIESSPSMAMPDMTSNADRSATEPQRAEVARIFAHAIYVGELPATDKTYVAQLLADRTNTTQAAAEKRIQNTFDTYKQNVENAIATAKESADAARKAAAYGSLWMFIALLCGAFIASLAATYGGRLRDRTDFDAVEVHRDDTVQPVTLS